MKNVEFIDIGNIGFLAACGFCILMVCARGARHTKGKSFAVKRGKGFHRLKVIFLSVSMEFWLVPGFKILSKWQANHSALLFFIINLRRVVQDPRVRGDSLFCSSSSVTETN